jgi:cytochrome c-type biogenesis protein
MEAFFDFSQPVTLPIAFFAGIASFFAPCVVPLLPAYIGYVTGVTTKSINKNGIEKYRKKIIVSSLVYILGFSAVFILMGLAAATFGRAFRLYSRELQIAGGLLLIFFGLDVAGYVNVGLIAKERKFVLPLWIEKLGYAKSFVLGIVFAAAWTPCIGPILGSILALAAVSSSAANGALLLFVYSIGISLPFLVVALGLAQAPKYLKNITKNIEKISKISGIILVIIGMVLLFGWYGNVNSFVVQWLEGNR